MVDGRRVAFRADTITTVIECEPCDDGAKCMIHTTAFDHPIVVATSFPELEASIDRVHWEADGK